MKQSSKARKHSTKTAKKIVAERAAKPTTKPKTTAQPSNKAIGRITNVRANANGITGGGPIPANAVAALSTKGD